MPIQLTLRTDDLRRLSGTRRDELRAFLRDLDPRLDPDLIQGLTFRWELMTLNTDISVRSLVIDAPPSDPHLHAVIRRYLTDLPAPTWLPGMART